MSVEEKNPRLEIKIASPNKIRELFGGEVHNYKTYQLDSSGKYTIPVEGGLFDINIFRNYKDCSCFKSSDDTPVIEKNANLICLKCTSWIS